MNRVDKRMLALYGGGLLVVIALWGGVMGWVLHAAAVRDPNGAVAELFGFAAPPASAVRNGRSGAVDRRNITLRDPDMDTIVASLAMTVAIPQTPCPAGTQLYAQVTWTNRGTRELSMAHIATGYYLIGTRFNYLERLGPDADIPVLHTRRPPRQRDGNRYRLTGENIRGRQHLRPGESVVCEGDSIDLIDTTGFPPGRYRYTVEYGSYEPSASAPPVPVQTQAVEFEVLPAVAP